MAKGLFQLAAKRKEGEAGPVLVTLGFGLCQFFFETRKFRVKDRRRSCSCRIDSVLEPTSFAAVRLKSPRMRVSDFSS